LLPKCKGYKVILGKIHSGFNGRVHKAKCKVWRKIKGYNKLFVLKLNFLWKHIGQRQATTTILNVGAIREHYFSKTNQHVFNENLYVSKDRDYVMQQVVAKIVVEGKKRLFILYLSFICILKVGL
jgi:hypothetical protein